MRFFLKKNFYILSQVVNVTQVSCLCVEGWPWTSDSSTLKMLEFQECTTVHVLCNAGVGAQGFVVHARQASNVPTEH